MKKMTSLLLTLCMILALLPAVSMPAAAAGADEEDALSALGFDTSEEPDDYIAGDSASTPFGADITMVAPVSELYTMRKVGGASLYGDDLELDATTEALVDSGKYAGSSLMLPTTYQAAAGSFGRQRLRRGKWPRSRCRNTA